jgi:hypothetical protein
MGMRAAPRGLGGLVDARREVAQEPKAARALIGLTAAVSLLALAAASPNISTTLTHRPLAFIEFCLVAVALAWTPIEVYGRGSFTFAGAGLLATSFTLGVGAGMLAAFVVATVILVRSGGMLHRAAFNAATLSLAAAAGGGVFDLVTWSSASGWPKLLAAACAGAVFYLVNIALLSVAMGVSEQMSPLNVWRERFRWLAPYYLASGALGLAVALAFQRIGIGGLAAFALPPALS